MKKYPSIEQFRNVIKEVRLKHDYKGKDSEGKQIYKHTENYPTLKFNGTVKLHGTNASVVKYSNGNIQFQSRERILSLEYDNANFMLQMLPKNLDFLFKDFTFNDYIAIYGEWCGGNIQKGVAISGLPKMFVIFGVKIDDNWIKLPSTLYDNSQNIYNILQFKTFEIDIDFNNPELSQNKLIEMTISVEDVCPVGEYFGVKGTGEGIVFVCESNPSFRFKSKGEKHSVSKVKTLNSIDIDTVNSINEFVESVVTENRLNQGISYLIENNIEVDTKNTGQFLGWIVKDVLKEEIDSIVKNGLDVEKVKKTVVNKARVWFLNKI